MDSQLISQKILQSKKYKVLNPQTVNRVVNQFSSDKDTEMRSRRLLHQIWGSYYPTEPNFKKLLAKFAEARASGNDFKKAVLPLLQAHASTKERVSLLDQFYKQIFKVTGQPNSVVDLGCGLNPLTLPWMELSSSAHYFGFDIDQAMVDFNCQVLEKSSYKDQSEVLVGDLFDRQVHSADVAMLLKVLPVVEQQSKGASLNLLRQINSKYLIISFPVASVSGKYRSMVGHYREWFNKLVENEDWKTSEILFETELVYVVKKAEK